MTSFDQYFRSHLKASIRPIICIIAVVLLLTLIICINAQPTVRYDIETQESLIDYDSTLYVPVLFLCILAYVLPVMEFSFFKKRINLDCVYSLPISRRAMGTVHYLLGLITLIVTFTSSYLLNFVMLLSRGPEYFNFVPMIAHYFLCLLHGFAMYSVMVFVFNEANTKGDGIWFMVLYTFVFFLIVFATEDITSNWDILEHEYFLIPWGIIANITTIYQHLVEIDSAYWVSLWQKQEIAGWFIFWMIAGIASAVGFFVTFGKRRMERTEEISDSYFGYRVLIPIYAISGMIFFGTLGSILGIIIELFAILGYTIYRRGFHYKKSDIAILALLLLFLFIDI